MRGYSSAEHLRTTMPCAPILCRMQSSNDCEHEGSYQSIERHLLGRSSSANVGRKPGTDRPASCLHRPSSDPALASYNGWYGRCVATTRPIWLQIRSSSFRGLQRQLLPDPSVFSPFADDRRGKRMGRGSKQNDASQAGKNKRGNAPKTGFNAR